MTPPMKLKRGKISDELEEKLIMLLIAYTMDIYCDSVTSLLCIAFFSFIQIVIALQQTNLTFQRVF